MENFTRWESLKSGKFHKMGNFMKQKFYKFGTFTRLIIPQGWSLSLKIPPFINIDLPCTLCLKSYDPCFHMIFMEARVMTFVAHCVGQRTKMPCIRALPRSLLR